MISLPIQYLWPASLILVASVHGCSAYYGGGTPSEMRASEGKTVTTGPADVADQGGLIHQKASPQDDHVTRQ